MARRAWNREQLIDYHIHPSCSVDADSGATVDAYAQRALELGLSEICLTTHCDRDPARREIEGWLVVDGQRVPNTDPAAWDRYVAEVLEVREAFAPRGLWVGLGLEVDYFPGVAGFVADTLARHPFDFVIGSVHCLDRRNLSTPEEAPACFAGLSVQEMAARYFDLVAEAAAAGLFDVIGHLDIYKLYGREVYGDDVLAAHGRLAEPALQVMARHGVQCPFTFRRALDGVGLEVNTAAWRKGCAEQYPGAELLALARAAGVPTLTFGSDAHRLADLGRDLGPAVASAIRAGYRTAHRFRQRRVSATIPLADDL